MSKKQKTMLTRILAAAGLLGGVKLLPEIRLPIHLPLSSSPAAQNGRGTNSPQKQSALRNWQSLLLYFPRFFPFLPVYMQE